jgi:hypothetical protein
MVFNFWRRIFSPFDPCATGNVVTAMKAHRNLEVGHHRLQPATHDVLVERMTATQAHESHRLVAALGRDLDHHRGLDRRILLQRLLDLERIDQKPAKAEEVPWQHGCMTLSPNFDEFMVTEAALSAESCSLPDLGRTGLHGEIHLLRSGSQAEVAGAAPSRPSLQPPYQSGCFSGNPWRSRRPPLPRQRAFLMGETFFGARQNFF